MAKSRHTIADRLKVGDQARLRVGPTLFDVVVIEDRGRLGVAGRHMYRVQTTEVESAEPSAFDVRADDLELVVAAHRRS